jgi:Ca2+/Na+ antiporter
MHLILVSAASGTGHNPSTGGGIAIIAGCVVLAVLVIGLASWFLTRSTRRNRAVHSEGTHSYKDVGS